MRLFTILIISLISLSVNSQTVNIYGNAKDYAYKKLFFTKYSDLITLELEIIDSCIVNEDGDFSCSFNLEQTNKIITNLGIYDCSFYAQPNKQYEIILPPLIEKQLKDSLNPYFKPFKMELGIKNLEKNDINILIQKFDKQYNSYINLHFYEMIRQRQNSSADSMISVLNTNFNKYQNTYFSIYKHYKIEFLRYAAYKRDIKWVTHHHYKNKPIYYSNTAYMDLFTKMYSNYFKQLRNTKYGKTIYSNINLSKSSNKIKETLNKEISLGNDTLQELVILKSLNDALTDPYFRNRFVLQALDTLIRYTKVNKHKAIAINIKRKASINKTIASTISPDFNLYDKDSNLVKLKDYRGKYVYLNIVISDSYSCMQDYGVLKNLYNKHKNDFEIITLLVDLYPNQIQEFVDIILPKSETKIENQANTNWKFLSIKDNLELLKDFKVVTYPTYVLIDPYGTIISATAPSPNENFEQYFYRILRSRN